MLNFDWIINFIDYYRWVCSLRSVYEETGDASIEKALLYLQNNFQGAILCATNFTLALEVLLQIISIFFMIKRSSSRVSLNQNIFFNELHKFGRFTALTIQIHFYGVIANDRKKAPQEEF